MLLLYKVKTCTIAYNNKWLVLKLKKKFPGNFRWCVKASSAGAVLLLGHRETTHSLSQVWIGKVGVCFLLLFLFIFVIFEGKSFLEKFQSNQKQVSFLTLPSKAELCIYFIFSTVVYFSVASQEEEKNQPKMTVMNET